MAVTTETHQLPERLGDFARIKSEVLTVALADRQLYEEYGYQAAYRAEYADTLGRGMTVDAFRFLNSEGAHAAYLCSRPVSAVSPMIWRIPAATGGGITVMEYQNYTLHFRGALPSVSSDMAEMIAALPGLTVDEAPWNLDGRYLDVSSTRMILGPVSLERFAGRIPPSAAGFSVGAKGRVARFETPAGVMTEILFEYPTETTARERAKALGALPGAFVRVDRACVGMIFEPVDPTIAKEMLSGYFGAPVAARWDSLTHTAGCGPVTLDQGIGMALWGFLIGALIAVVRRLGKRSDPFPERMIFLRL